MKKGKRILSFLLALVLLVGLMPTALAAPAEDEAYSIDNGYIKVQVSRENGGFTVGTTEGNRLKKSDDNKALLYHDGQYDTSFVSFEVTPAGSPPQQYIFGGKYGGLGDPSRDGVTVTQPGGANDDILAVWSVGELTFTQSISLANEASNEHGMVSVSVKVENGGAQPVSVGARVLYDTYLGASDFGYYQIADSGGAMQTYTTETTLDVSDPAVSQLPQNFFAADDALSPQIMAYTASSGASTPVKAAFGHWNNLAASLYDFTPDGSMDFTDPLNEYYTADSAYALYYALNNIAAGADASLTTFYGVFSNSAVSAQERVAVNVTAPTRLELNADKTGYEALVSPALGQTDFQIGVTFENYESDGAADIANAALVVQTTGNLRPLNSEDGTAYAEYGFGGTEPFMITYQDVEVGGTRSKTLNFEAQLCENAAYERVTIGVYDVGATGGQLAQEHLLGEKVVYVLLPGSDGGIPKVGFTAMTPNTIYYSGTRHLYVNVTNSSMLDDRGNWNLYAYPSGGGSRVKIDGSTITINDGVMDIAIPDDVKLAAGSWYLQLEWIDSVVGDGPGKLVPERYGKQTADALKFTVSEDPKYKNDAYGVVAVAKYKNDNNSPYYRIHMFRDEAEYKKFESDRRADGGTKDYTEILLVFRGEFTVDNKMTDGNGVVHPLRLTAVSKKTLGDDRKYEVDNCVSLNNCLDFEGGSLSIYYKYYSGALDTAFASSVRVEFDGDLLTSDARTSVWKGKACLTELVQGREYSLLRYDANGVRDAAFSAAQPNSSTIKLVWPSVAGVGQTIAGMIFNLAFGELGVLTEKKNGETVEKGRVVSFSANLDLSFTGASDPSAPKKDTYWSRLKDVWAFHKRDVSLYEYAHNSGPIERMLDWSTIDESQSDTDKSVSGSVMVRDILFGCGEGFVGVNFTVSVAVDNYIDSLPHISGMLSVNTINNWSFALAGGVKLATFAMEVKLSFKSRNDIPVPDDIYFYIGGFKPGINIDGFGVVWITGGGGGISKLYDTIFCTQSVPPLKLILSVGFSIVQVLDGKATLGVGLTGISLKGEDLKIFGTIEAIRAVQLGLEWYPRIDLRASIAVNLFEGVINGGGYIVLVDRGSSDWFFEMFARAQLMIPESFPLVGGMVLAGVDLGINTEKIWGAIDVLMITLGITYYWGESDVDFGVGSKTNPTYPQLLGYDDVPVYYDAERDQTLYARVGTNISGMMRAETDADADGALTLMGTRGIWSNPARTEHSLDLGPYNSGDGTIVQLTYEADSLAAAKTLAEGFTIEDADDGTPYPLTWYSASGAASANANVTYDEVTETAAFAFTMTDFEAFDKSWSISTGATAASAVMYSVAPLPKLTAVSGANTTAGAQMTVTWAGSALDELDDVSLYLCETKDAEDAGIPLGFVTSDFADETASLAVPASVPSGDYYVKAVYVKDDSVNGLAFSEETVRIDNSATPGAAVISEVEPAGDLKLRVSVDEAADADGYSVTVYNDADGTASDISGLAYSRSASGATVFEVGGSYEYAEEEGGESTPCGLTGNTAYKVGVTPYKLIDTDINGEPDTAVYGAETMSAPVTLPTATTPTLEVSADRTAQTLSKPSISGGADVEYKLYTDSTLELTVTADVPVTGSWSLDGAATGEPGCGEYTGVESFKATLSGLPDGDHTLTITGRDAEGDGFRHDYCFTIDTEPPRLILSSPMNGSSFAWDGDFTLSGITDADALLSVTCDGAALVSGETVSERGGTLDASGRFSVTLTIPDPSGAAIRDLEITAADAAGNSVSRSASVRHAGLADIESVAVLVDDYLLSTGNIPVSVVASETHRLSLAGITSTGQRFSLDGLPGVRWSAQAVKGGASVDADGLLTLAPRTQGIVTGALEVTSGAHMTYTLTIGEIYESGIVAVSSTLGGVVTGGGVYEPGTLVTLSAVADAGYSFDGWTVVGAALSSEDSPSVSFTMPDSGNVAVTAVFKAVGGSVAVADGSIITVPIPDGADPNAYVPYYMKNGVKTYVQKSVAKNGMLIYEDPGFKCEYEVNKRDFADIEGHWAEDDIRFAAARGIVNGVENALFDPGGSLTRAMLLTILYRLDGSPQASGAVSFSDVDMTSWYASAVIWGVKNGITDGYNSAQFGPEDGVTREQMCTMIVRYLKYAGYTLPKTNEKLAFTDAGSISEWARSAIENCQTAGVVNGKTGGLFDPGSGATRAECCAVIHRLLNAIIG